jgi:hypothetical protein
MNIKFVTFYSLCTYFGMFCDSHASVHCYKYIKSSWKKRLHLNAEQNNMHSTLTLAFIYV